MQSLSKIERGVNYPTFDTLAKIMDVLGVTLNELLSGEWKFVQQTYMEVDKLESLDRHNLLVFKQKTSLQLPVDTFLCINGGYATDNIAKITS